MGIINKLSFVRDEINKIPDIENEPTGGIKSFSSRIGYALSLGFKEKEIFTFGLLQWVAIALGYLLWTQMLDWIPEDVWRSAARSDTVSTADIILLIWSFVCVAVVAYPVGILSGCMGTAHFLHKQNRESTIAACFRLVMPQSWPLWAFHTIDGWITVMQIMQRLPKKNDHLSASEKALSESLYYAWKLGVAGILPSIITGNGLIKSGKNSIVFVKDNFNEVAKLRAGYSLLCWIVGISAYVGTIALFNFVDIIPKSSEVYGHIYSFYLWAAIPILVALSIVMLLLRPIYILSICDLYSDHLKNKNISVNLPSNPSKAISALVVFAIICLMLTTVYLYRTELGIIDMLSVPHD